MTEKRQTINEKPVTAAYFGSGKIVTISADAERPHITIENDDRTRIYFWGDEVHALADLLARHVLFPPTPTA